MCYPIAALVLYFKNVILNALNVMLIFKVVKTIWIITYQTKHNFK